jgi:prepilin-type N-terminal cleavage/methylation domain-containing protein
MTTAPTDRLRRTGFSLTELLIVIGIIAILIGILFPIIKKVRYAAYKADTENEISQISNACNSYYSTYHAYPGPFSNYETQWGGAAIPTGTSTSGSNGTFNEQGFITLFWLYNGTNYNKISSGNPGVYFVTGAENLVLGLMGGLRPYPAVPPVTPTQMAFAPSEVGQGPMSLNPLNPGRQPSFFPNGTTYLNWCEQPAAGGLVYQTNTYNAADTLVPFTDGSQHQASNSPIPVFVDRYPSPGPLPILYLRARVGAKGVVSDGVIQDAGMAGLPAQYQYDLRDIIGFTNPIANANASATTGTTLAPIGLPNGFIHDLIAVVASGGSATINTTTINAYPPPGVVKAGAAIPLVGGTPTPNATAYQDGFPYFCNPAIAPNSTTILDSNYTCRPRAVDQFILISAGPDGIYGTADDLTSSGDMSQ